MLESFAGLLGRSRIGFLGLIGLPIGGGLELGGPVLGGLDRLFGPHLGGADDRIGLGPGVRQGVIAFGVHPCTSRSRLGAGLVPDGLRIGISLCQGLARLRFCDLEQVVDAAAGRACRLGAVIGGLLQLSLRLGQFAGDLELRTVGVDDLTTRIGERLAHRLDLGPKLLQARIDFTLFVPAHRCAEFFGGRH